MASLVSPRQRFGSFGQAGQRRLMSSVALAPDVTSKVVAPEEVQEEDDGAHSYVMGTADMPFVLGPAVRLRVGPTRTTDGFVVEVRQTWPAEGVLFDKDTGEAVFSNQSATITAVPLQAGEANGRVGPMRTADNQFCALPRLSLTDPHLEVLSVKAKSKKEQPRLESMFKSAKDIMEEIDPSVMDKLLDMPKGKHLAEDGETLIETHFTKDEREVLRHGGTVTIGADSERLISNDGHTPYGASWMVFLNTSKPTKDTRPLPFVVARSAMLTQEMDGATRSVVRVAPKDQVAFGSSVIDLKPTDRQEPKPKVAPLDGEKTPSLSLAEQKEAESGFGFSF